MDKTDRYTVEANWTIWDDRHGERLEVGPDLDGLNLVEIRERDANGKVTRSMVFTHEQARLLATILPQAAEKALQAELAATESERTEAFLNSITLQKPTGGLLGDDGARARS